MKLDLMDYFDKKTLVILDIDRLASVYYVSRYQKAFANMPLLTSRIDNKVVNTNITYKVVQRIVQAYYSIENVDIMLAFDTRPNFLNYLNRLSREDILKMPNDYYQQLTLIRKLGKDCNIRVLEKDGFEASSLIEKAVMDNQKYYDKIVMYSTDKFLYHLINNKVSMVRPTSELDLTVDTYKEVTKSEYNTYKLKTALVGDSGLGIKGVERFGEVTFNKFLEKEDVLSRLDSDEEIIKGSYLNAKQKQQALDCLDYLSSREIDFLDTTALSVDKVSLGAYLEFLDFVSLKEKL